MQLRKIAGLGKVTESIILASVVCSLVLAGAFWASPSTARAVSLSPLTFDINVNPGETVSDFVTVSNNESAKQVYVLEAEDFAAVGEAGNVVIDKDAPRQVSAKQWVTFDPQIIEVEPGGSKTVKFTLNVPRDADPGGKYTSLLVGTSPGSEGGGVGIASRVASLLLIRVAGDVTEKITVESFETKSLAEFGPVSFTLRLKNEGTIHLKPAGFIFIKNWRGQEVEKISLPQQRIIPGTIRAIGISWDAIWLFGKYTATFQGIYGSKNDTLSASVSFWVIPWKLLGSLLLALLVIGIIIWKIRKRLALALKILFGGSV